ncbi:MAG: hypothetical protein RRA32_02910 [bacterium]|nr:hypothetical protein [bacterium]
MNRIRAAAPSLAAPCILLISILLPCPANASRVADLDLATRLDHWTTVNRVIENPHDLECTNCHLEIPRGSADGKFLLPDDTISLCKSCHGGPDIHPVKVATGKPESELADFWLPLGKKQSEGMIICLTCHYIHSTDYYGNLLRGDDASDGHRSDFLCTTCHGANLRDQSPHNRSGKSCTFCHTKSPRPEDAPDEILRSDIQNRCNFCHDTLDQGHYLAVNPFSDPAFSGGDLKIPLLAGRFTCISCHDPHATENRRQKLLRPDYLKLASVSRRINPHWKDVMCISCHIDEPAMGNPRLKYQGNITLLCNRCHDGEIARNDIHPVDIQPSDNVVIPEKMPLSEGFLTCATCHDSSLQEGGEKRLSVGRNNPSFLRGGIETRNEYCFRCHLPEHYGKLDAHLQMSEAGSVMPQSCLFCHSSLPDTKVAGIESVTFNTESLDDYCTVCHAAERFVTEHPVGEHLVEPSRDVYRAIETAQDRIGVNLPLFNGRITCVTCHNPHQEGVLKVRASATGSGEENRLRLKAGRWQCVGCHLGKGVD